MKRLFLLLCIASSIQLSAQKSSENSLQKQQLKKTKVDATAFPNFFVNGINIAWIEFARDIGLDPSNSQNEYHPKIIKFGEAMDLVKNNGGNVIRWWYHINGATNPVFNIIKDKEGKSNLGKTVNGKYFDGKVLPNPSFFHEDVKSILDLAVQKGIQVQICLWSFDMLKTNWYVNTEVNKLLLTKESHTKAYIDNALLPLVNAIGDHPGLFAWEIFNEPEGMTDEHAGHWAGFERRVEMKDIQKFINKTAAAIRKNQPNVKITNGAIGFKTNVEDRDNGYINAYSDANLIKAGGEKEGYLDFYNIHYYNWARAKGSPFHVDYDLQKVDKKAVIAEYYPDDLKFSQNDYDNDHKLRSLSHAELGTALIEKGWHGSLSWSWTDRKTVEGRERMTSIMNGITNAGIDTPPIIADGVYTIKAANSEQRIISRAEENYSAKMQDPGDYEDLVWIFKYIGNDLYTIKNKSNNRFLEVRDAKCANDSDVASWTEANDAHQKWKILKNGSGVYAMIPSHCQQKALDREGGNRDANVLIWDFSKSNKNQKWNIIPFDDNILNTENFVNDNKGIQVYSNRNDSSLVILGIKKGDPILVHNLLGELLASSVSENTSADISLATFRSGIYLLSVPGKIQKKFLKF